MSSFRDSVKPNQLASYESIWSGFNISQDAKKSKEGKDQESIQSSTTPDPGHHMGKWQKHNHTQESQEVHPFPASDHKDVRNRQNRLIKTNVKHK